MKTQYLGDAKDSFKWDYHDYVTHALGFSQLTLVLMLTEDDTSADGQKPPEHYPPERRLCSFVTLCKNIVPCDGCGAYRSKPAVPIPWPCIMGAAGFTADSRRMYFEGMQGNVNQVVFVDPDTGFEPENSRYSEKHVRFCEVNRLVEQISPESVVSVFSTRPSVSVQESICKTIRRHPPPPAGLFHRALLGCLRDVHSPEPLGTGDPARAPHHRGVSQGGGGAASRFSGQIATVRGWMSTGDFPSPAAPGEERVMDKQVRDRLPAWRWWVAVGVVFVVCAVSGPASAEPLRSWWYVGGGLGGEWGARHGRAGWNRDTYCYPSACDEPGLSADIAGVSIPGYRWAYDLDLDIGTAFEVAVGRTFKPLAPGIGLRAPQERCRPDVHRDGLFGWRAAGAAVCRQPGGLQWPGQD